MWASRCEGGCRSNELGDKYVEVNVYIECVKCHSH